MPIKNTAKLTNNANLRKLLMCCCALSVVRLRGKPTPQKRNEKYRGAAVYGGLAGLYWGIRQCYKNLCKSIKSASSAF